MSYYPTFVNAGWASIRAYPHSYVIVGIPDNVEPGNLLIAAFQSNEALTDVSAPPGWQVGDAQPNPFSFWLYKIADGTEGSTFTLSWSETTASVFGQVIQIFGAEANNPFGEGSQDSALFTPMTSDSINTLGNLSLVVCFQMLSYETTLASPVGFDTKAQSSGVAVSGAAYAITVSTVDIATAGSASPAADISIPNNTWSTYQIEVLAADIGAIAQTLDEPDQLVAGAQLGGPGSGGWYSWWMNG